MGKTLTADLSGIEDENGLDRVKFHYQWISSDGTDEGDIEGGTDASYVLVADDEGRFIKVRVSFTDRDGYAESVPSAATTEVEPPPKPPSPPLNLEVTNNENGELALSWEAPASDGGSAVMGYKVRWKSESEEYGPSREASVSVLSYTVRELTKGVEHSVQVVAVNEVGDGEAAEITATPRDTIPPELLTARVNGPTITLNYDEALDPNSTPPTSAFSVLVGGTAREVSEVSISGSSVSFTLASAVTPDDTVALSYSAPQDTGEQRVQDTTGNNAPSFSEEPVANDTPTPNTRSTGAPTIDGNAQVGETLTADTSAIVDAEGLTNVVFSYQWIRNDGPTDADIDGANGATYTLVKADEGTTLWVTVSFTDAEGNPETLTSEPTGEVAAKPNTSATGVPTITGTVQVGQTLTADMTGIDDEDGLTNVVFAYQWAADDANIQDATDPTYTLTEDDEGKTIKVRVSFTDDANYEESLTSDPTGPVVPDPGPLTGFTLVDTSSDPDTVLGTLEDGGTLTLEDPDSDRHGIRVDTDSNDDIHKVELALSGAKTEGKTEWQSPYSLYGDGGEGNLTGEDLPAGAYEMRATAYDDDGDVLGTLKVSFTVTAGQPAQQQPTVVPNTSATGVPTISGTAQVGETLTAHVTGIADADGLTNAVFSYQWVRSDGETYADIAGATGATFTLTEDDADKTIKVTVSFTDDGNNEESLPSAATDAVAPDPGTLTGFALLDASDQTVVATLSEGDEVGLPDPADGIYAIRADAEPGATIGSVKLELTGAKDVSRTEVAAPYSLYGDGAEGLHGEVLPAGAYTLRATAYSERDGGGDVLETDAISFTVNSPTTGEPATEVALPVHITRSDWRWDRDEPHHAVNIDFTIHEDPGDTVGSGIYFMLGYSYLGRTSWYAGLQTNVLRPGEGGVGKGFIFSRWDTRSLDHTRPTEAGWTQSSGHEGDFVGVRHPYPWTTGSYTVKIGPDASGNGWYGAWITEHNGGEITWLGSLRFEEEEEHGTVLVSILEAYGRPIKMVDIPLSKITIEPPYNERGERPTSVRFRHSGTVTNHDIEYDEVTGQVTFTAGGNTVLRNIHSHSSQYQVPSAEVTHNSNSPATGAPTISGTIRVSETLTADVTGIADEDGLDNVVLIYQWMADDVAIAGANGSSYTLVSDDEGKAITVRVSFTDDANNEESLTSEPTGPVVPDPGPVTVFKVVDTSSNPDTVLGTLEDGGTLTLEDPDSDRHGIRVDTDSGHDDHDDIHKVELDLTGAKTRNKEEGVFPYSLYGDEGEGNLTGEDLPAGAYELRATAYDDDGDVLGTLKVSFTVTAGQPAQQQPTVVPNTSATGVPTIGGTAQVGETLTADVTGIADADGLTNVVFAYQWMADDTAIQDATGSSYTLTGDDAGKAITVTVSFTDAEGNPETLTSDPTSEVAAKPNTSATGAPTISGTAQVGQTLTASTAGIVDADGLTTVSYSYQWLADDANIQGATSSSYTLTSAEQGKAIKVRVSFTDDVGHEESLPSAATAAVAAAANNKATGQPTISGTLQVGETLTADTSGIGDADGLTTVSYSYQWMADDTNIPGATDRTYTLAEDDEGKAIKVLVSFTDAEGNPETLTSDPTGEVAAKPNTSATGVPTISGTLQVGQTLTADTSGIDDEDGLTNAVFSYQWVADDEDIAGATGSSYTLTEDDEDKTITVTVSFTDAEGNPETLTSDPTGEVEAKPNTSATGVPTIEGTAQVGQTLTADTSGIDDEDGLTQVVFSYQWIRNDGNADEDIAGATGSSYTLTGDDEGKTVRVMVSFTDAEGNPETLTSDPTAEVDSEAGPLTGFTVVDAADTAQAVLWKHQTDGSKPEEGDTWKEWTDAGTLALGDPENGKYGIRADTESGEGIHRVALELTGEKKVERTDDAAPYSLYGDEWEDALHGESLPVGSYTLKATAYTEDGETLGSLEISFTVALVLPGKPQSLAGEATAQEIKLTWKAPTGSVVVEYVVYRGILRNGSMNGQALSKHATIDAAGKAMTYTDDNVEEGVEYRYRVAAVNSAGEGKKSTWLDITAE